MKSTNNPDFRSDNQKTSSNMGFCDKCGRQDIVENINGEWLCTVCLRDKDRDIVKKEIKDFKKSEADF